MRKKLLLLSIIIILLFLIQTASAQLIDQAKIDSLLKELTNTKEDTNRVNLFSEISIEYRYINPDKGIIFGERGVKLANKLNWSNGKAKCLNSIGVNYTKQSDFQKALENFHKALDNYRELDYKKGIANILSNMAAIYYEKSNYLKALELYLQSLKIDEEIGNKLGVANNLGNIGNIFLRQTEYSKALKYYKKALKINEELNDKHGLASNLGNIGLIYDFQYNNIKALEYYKKALKIDRDLNYKKGISISLSNIGSIYKRQSEYSVALEYFLESLINSKEINDKKGIASSLGNLGKLFRDLSKDSLISINENNSQLILDNEVNNNKAIEYFTQAIVIFKEIGNLSYLSNYLSYLSDAYEQKGDYKKAYKTYKEHKELDDSIYSSENQTKIANLEAKRENELKEKEIVILKKEKENQKLQRYAMFGGIAGLGIIIGLILIQRRKSEKLLLNVLPFKIAKRLKANEHPIADHFDCASIMFIDIVGFTKLSSEADPKRIVAVLNDIFTVFDKLADKYGLEKIKTIGDSYMAVCGIPEIKTDHAKQTALMALEIRKIMDGFTTSDGTEIHFRIGIDCGSVVAGVIGEKKFIYDLWSDAVNTASRMESTGKSDKIQVSENFKTELEKFDGNWKCNYRGEIDIKGKGIMNTYFLEN